MSNDPPRPDDMEREPPNWKLLVIILVVGATVLIGAMVITWYRRR